MYSLPTPHQLKLFRFIADQGITAVIGHHSHVPGGFEYYNNTPLVYSLGNFIFDEDGNSPEWYEGIMVGLTITNDLKTEVDFYPVHLHEGELGLTEKPLINADDHQYPYLKIINDEEVVNGWNKMIINHYDRVIKSLLSSNLIVHLLLKFRIITIKNHRRFLIPLLNKFRCQTHRDFSIDSIKRFINSN
jgi:poly-gamma-glutamate synthesis protein (capsule biosynthesis protein)